MPLRFLAAASLFAILAAPASPQGYTVNGVPLDIGTQQYLYGLGLPPGHYWLRPDGVWGAMGDWRPLGRIRLPAATGPMGGGTTYFSGGPVMGGSGQVNPDGTGTYYNGNTGVNFGNLGGGCYMVNGYSTC